MRLTQRKAILVVAILVVIACFFAVYLRLFTGKELWYEMFAAILGVIITAIITVLLLKGQTENEEKLEKSVKIFEYKQKVLFRVEIENSIYYGFRHVANQEEDGIVCSIASQVSNSCVKTQKWSGRKWFDHANLDFWKLNSGGIEKLQDSRIRDKFIDELVNEMDMYIQKFISIAKEKGL